MQGVDPAVIMGDFNTPDINWSTLSVNLQFSSKIYGLITTYSLCVEHPLLIIEEMCKILFNHDENIASLQVHTEDNLSLTYTS